MNNRLTYSSIEPLTVIAAIITLIGWGLGEINWWIAVPILLLTCKWKIEL